MYSLSNTDRRRKKKLCKEIYKRGIISKMLSVMCLSKYIKRQIRHVKVLFE